VLVLTLHVAAGAELFGAQGLPKRNCVEEAAAAGAAWFGEEENLPPRLNPGPGAE